MLTEFWKKKFTMVQFKSQFFRNEWRCYFLSQLSTLICEKIKYPTRLTGKKLHIHSIINWRKIDDILINSKPKKAKLCYTQICTLNTFSSRLLTLLPHVVQTEKKNQKIEKKIYTRTTLKTTQKPATSNQKHHPLFSNEFR